MFTTFRLRRVQVWRTQDCLQERVPGPVTMTASTKPKGATAQSSASVSRRTALISGAVLALAAALTIRSMVASDDPTPLPTPAQTTTTKVPDPALHKLDEELSGAVNLSVAFAGSVQVLDRELRAGTLPGDELARRAVAFEDQVTQSLTTVSELKVPEGAQAVKVYAIEAMRLYQISTLLLQGEGGVVDTRHSGLAVRVKLLADRVFDRARIALDVETNGAPSASGQRVLTSPAIPDFAAEAPDTGSGPGVAPAPERPLGAAAWRSEVRRQALAVGRILDAIDWPSVPSDDAEAFEQQMAITRSTDALAIVLPDLSLTEAGRTLRLATAVLEQAVASRRIGAIQSAAALLDAGRRIWAVGAEDAEASPTLGTTG